MLALAVILLILGAVVAYVGRPREQLIYIAGLLIFVAGVIVLVLWLINTSGADDAAFILPSALAFKKGDRKWL
jgi:predicted membrane protein